MGSGTGCSPCTKGSTNPTGGFMAQHQQRHEEAPPFPAAPSGITASRPVLVPHTQHMGPSCTSASLLPGGLWRVPQPQHRPRYLWMVSSSSLVFTSSSCICFFMASSSSEAEAGAPSSSHLSRRALDWGAEGGQGPAGIAAGGSPVQTQPGGPRGVLTLRCCSCLRSSSSCRRLFSISV